MCQIPCLYSKAPSNHLSINTIVSNLLYCLYVEPLRSHEATWTGNLEATNCRACYRTTLTTHDLFDPPRKICKKFKCECLFFLEIAWNWLPVKWQFQVATVLFFQSYSNFSLFICILIAKKDSKRVQGVALQNNINRYVGLPIIPKLIFYGFFCRPTSNS